MNTFRKWKQELVKDIDGMSPIQLLSLYSAHIMQQAVETDMNKKEKHSWFSSYLRHKLEPLLYPKDKKIDALQENLNIITQREKKARERVKALEKQLNKLKDEQKRLL